MKITKELCQIYLLFPKFVSKNQPEHEKSYLSMPAIAEASKEFKYILGLIAFGAASMVSESLVIHN